MGDLVGLGYDSFLLRCLRARHWLGRSNKQTAGGRERFGFWRPLSHSCFLAHLSIRVPTEELWTFRPVRDNVRAGWIFDCRHSCEGSFGCYDLGHCRWKICRGGEEWTAELSFLEEDPGPPFFD